MIDFADSNLPLQRQMEQVNDDGEHCKVVDGDDGEQHEDDNGEEHDRR